MAEDVEQDPLPHMSAQLKREIELLRAKAFATMEQNMAEIFQEMEQIRSDNRELDKSVAALLTTIEAYGKANSEARKQMQAYQKQLLQLMKSAQTSSDGASPELNDIAAGINR